jgi:hypothetical protein
MAHVWKAEQCDVSMNALVPQVGIVKVDATRELVLEVVVCLDASRRRWGSRRRRLLARRAIAQWVSPLVLLEVGGLNTSPDLVTLG